MDRTIEKWEVEDQDFWSSTGSKIASRNLWISIPSLLLAFAIWMAWSVITVQMKNLGFPFDTVQLFTLSAIAGLSGATLRIPNSFLIAIAGGRNVIAFTTALLLLPAIGLGIALQNIETPFATFTILAALSGLGGGNFSSSMSNISFFFPKKMQGLSLGLNAGLGNIGVSVMQLLIPFVVTFGLFGALGGGGLPLVVDAGGNPAGTIAFIQNAGLVWVPLLLLLAIAAWFGMNNLSKATPKLGSTMTALAKIFGLLMIGGVGAAVGLYLLLSLELNMWLVLPITIVLTVLMLKAIPGEIKENLNTQFVIFKNKHNWIMTYLYTMTFGSFIGYSAAFPLLIRVVFGELPDGSINPNAPNPFAYAWLGPLVGSIARPIGGWISDKWGGAKVTQWDTVVMIASALGVAYYVKEASNSPTPEAYFMPFLILFLILFITTGIGNGSTFRMVPIIFKPSEAGPVLGWTAAVAAYGAFIIPRIFGQQVNAGTPEFALYGFAFYYLTCLVLNWYYYARKNAEIVC
ncbi:MAG: antiporter [Chloroflexi bacterium]|jgi:MFS transporter, NNP family, nitrate/nitrite transporter|nr:antiporter [Chloroflexota bacterium]MBT3670327.1 antiporter [Chloroflexota bacterium]MBT4002609.1 antiporter [Chloroflexota bacterium]MBT4305515.1 antiporter [Chloroflexota bacterium]MBT4533126.1 antiporter [Chloroflexota bacterium]